MSLLIVASSQDSENRRSHLSEEPNHHVVSPHRKDTTTMHLCHESQTFHLPVQSRYNIQ